MIHIENTRQFDEVIQEGVTLVDFYATWCGPCRMLAPFVEEIENDYKDKIKVAKLDVDECGEIASRYAINAIPALLVFKDNELVNSNVGFIPKDDIANMIDEILSK
jgi:thioredoxin 1